MNIEEKLELLEFEKGLIKSFLCKELDALNKVTPDKLVVLAKFYQTAINALLEVDKDIAPRAYRRAMANYLEAAANYRDSIYATLTYQQLRTLGISTKLQSVSDKVAGFLSISYVDIINEKINK